MIQALSKRPLKRAELAEAVAAEGFKFNSKSPLNSIGSVLYRKNAPFKNAGGMDHYTGGSSAASTTSEANGPAHGKRTVSAQGKARMAAAQRARWAKQRGETPKAQGRKKKRTMSPEARARISAAEGALGES